MLKKISSLVLAENFINTLQNDERAENLKGFIECYQNGREHGFVIFGTGGKCNFRKGKFLGQENVDLWDNKAYYICQARRTDVLGIYVGSYERQGMPEDAYNNCKYFEKEFALTVGVDWIIAEITKDNLNPNGY